ncbi:MAG: beta-N-acetylhexosaminidase [Geminicoccales bacterium]
MAKAAIVGVAGLTLEAAERQLFSENGPLGFILFARNCDHPDQVRALVDSLRALIDDSDCPILIDQEGGRVTRLKPPAWPAMPALRPIGRLGKVDLETAKQAAWLHARLIASDLEPLGITVNCAPVLDLGLSGQTEAIGNRAISDDPSVVAVLGEAMIQGYLDGGILPVIKHLPGHGRARIDSHLDLPKVEASRGLLKEQDWRPFCACATAPFGMTAHILFQALDGAAPATQSRTIIDEVIRGEIGFDGVLLSDDLSMEALGGSLHDRAAAAIAAGCDVALHCNGDLEEMSQVLAAAGELAGEAQLRVERARERRSAPLAFDREAGRQRLDELLAPFLNADMRVA